MTRRVLSGLTPLVVARATGVDVKTVRKWVKRFQSEGLAAWRPLVATAQAAAAGIA
jgi:hypothetical protein